MTWRVGILGHGYMGSIRQAVLQQRTDCEVAAIFDGVGSGWHDVVDDPALDCIFVCLPSHLTCEAVCRSLSTGKHVFAEKPPGLSAAEVRRMMAAESASKKKLKFGFNHRYHPAIRAAKRRIDTGGLGALRWLRGRYGKPIAADFDNSWRADRARAGGGIFLDQGIHMLDLMRMFSGGFNEVKALASASVSEEVEDEMLVILQSEGGALASLHSSHTQWQPIFSLELGLSAGAVTLEGLLSRTGRYGPERMTWRTREDPELHLETFAVDDSWELEIDELFDSAESGAPIQVGSSGEALELMTLVEAIYASAGWPLGIH